MWPKALMQLLELAPHVTRLVPMADKFLQSRSENRDDLRRSVEQMAEGLRGGLREISATQAGIYQKLSEQDEMLAKIATDVQASKMANDEIVMRMAQIDARLTRLWIAFFAVVVLLMVASVVAGIAVVHLRHVTHGS